MIRKEATIRQVVLRDTVLSLHHFRIIVGSFDCQVAAFSSWAGSVVQARDLVSLQTQARHQALLVENEGIDVLVYGLRGQ